jgi:hypothetical protein
LRRKSKKILYLTREIGVAGAVGPPPRLQGDTRALVVAAHFHEPKLGCKEKNGAKLKSCATRGQCYYFKNIATEKLAFLFKQIANFSPNIDFKNRQKYVSMV